MGTAPLDRDMQIELMKAARERHDALVSRWKNNEVVRSVVSQPSHAQSQQYVQSSETVKLKCVG